MEMFCGLVAFSMCVIIRPDRASIEVIGRKAFCKVGDVNTISFIAI